MSKRHYPAGFYFDETEEINKSAKRIHKGTLTKSYRGEFARGIESRCKVENKTACYHLNYRWEKVTCRRCLATKGKKNRPKRKVVR